VLAGSIPGLNGVHVQERSQEKGKGSREGPAERGVRARDGTGGSRGEGAQWQGGCFFVPGTQEMSMP